ncbi:MAG: tRNA lysidine(34) synthetase TilS [Kangiellaceae bacterium]|jgi:tRNA(Ile)-lysidine synthase|nr:tRNA lysidine(34) synthetase TilS [Kangiellaceae bacterium]
MFESFRNHLKSFIERHQLQQANWLVGFSGGCDSMLLLYSLAQLRQQFSQLTLSAIYIDHQISQYSSDWAQHCQAFCHEYSINFHCHVTELEQVSRQGLEQRAREARWRSFHQHLMANDVLALGHHLTDNIETYFLQILRGANVQGASAMRSLESRLLPDGQDDSSYFLARPMLEYTRTEIESMATELHLSWINDDSNQSCEINRNYLRHKVFSEIEKRWPNYHNAINRHLHLLQDNKLLLNDLAQIDANTVIEQGDIIITRFNRLADYRRANLLAWWCRQQIRYSLSQSRIQDLVRQLGDASPTSNIEIQCGRHSIRQDGDRLVIALSVENNFIIDHKLVVSWHDIRQAIDFDHLQLRVIEKTSELSVRPPTIDEQVTIRYRQGGERCLPLHRNHSTTLKKYYQEINLPKDQRVNTPLIYYGDRLVAAVGIFVEQQFAASDDQSIVFTCERLS